VHQPGEVEQGPASDIRARRGTESGDASFGDGPVRLNTYDVSRIRLGRAEPQLPGMKALNCKVLALLLGRLLVVV
jgi:hypothetical protein